MRTHIHALLGPAIVTGMALSLAVPASAQYSSDFEALNASGNGVLLTGQDGYYIPDGTDSVDFYAFTYNNNGIGLPKNPRGGAQFIAGSGPGSPTFARAQRDMTWGSGIWEVSVDVCCTYLGSGESQDNLGSFSLQPYPGSASYIQLFSWMDPTNPVAWRSTFNAYDENGNGYNGVSPGEGWQNLKIDHWYRLRTTLDFDQNRILQTSIADLSTGETTSTCFGTMYLEGGRNGSAQPTGFRFFAGGGVPDNVTAYDNIGIEPTGRSLWTCINGDCPGLVSISVSGATSRGDVALVAGLTGGQYVNPKPPCQGITIDINPPFLNGFPRVERASSDGKVFIAGDMPRNLCGRLYVQAVDLTTCNVSNAANK
ncbi:MAG: hypothetical protein D8M59_03475 [Planctomycetes bacterium]|nr:hypothetical protein [Planctomycetota bacterium]NOG53057.1 hypothetical protein [Planctomycetota bacterium]